MRLALLVIVPLYGAAVLVMLAVAAPRAIPEAAAWIWNTWRDAADYTTNGA